MKISLQGKVFIVLVLGLLMRVFFSCTPPPPNRDKFQLNFAGRYR